MSDYVIKPETIKYFFQNKLFNVINLSISQHKTYLTAMLSPELKL